MIAAQTWKKQVIFFFIAQISTLYMYACIFGKKINEFEEIMK